MSHLTPAGAQASAPDEVRRVVEFLRTGQPGLKTRSGVMNEKRVDYFKRKHALRVLMSDEYSKLKGVPPVATEDEARALLARILPFAFFLLIERNDQGALVLVPQQDFKPDGLYVWLYDGPAWRLYAMAAAIIAAVILYTSIPLWPYRVQLAISYIPVAAIAFLAFYVAVALLRQVIFALTSFAFAPGIWVFPNWHEDCTVLESFVPVWAWHDPSAVHAKKAAKKRERKGRKPKTQSQWLNKALPNAMQFEDTARLPN
ncbi:translocation protein [Exidia glandulosa HHB12029]|uniref:Translocation protein SEC62 n=1 Tax=Exidia glandulosa HHB12029 TaxID=1314781 RepID=A0A165I0I4_EXIGL|nr:translocation protein [Exidia glandulosa HHB12029]